MKMHSGPSDLHIIIHGRGQKLSILRLTSYMQSAEETKERPLRSCGGRETDIFRQSVIDIFRLSPEGKQTFFGESVRGSG